MLEAAIELTVDLWPPCQMGIFSLPILLSILFGELVFAQSYPLLTSLYSVWNLFRLDVVNGPCLN
jgi:hypothetical protein